MVTISTISGVVNIVNDLDVDGHTNLDNVSVAGVTTFGINAKVTDDLTISVLVLIFILQIITIIVILKLMLIMD